MPRIVPGRDRLDQLVQGLRSGAYPLEASRVLPLGEIAEAHRLLEARRKGSRKARRQDHLGDVETGQPLQLDHRILQILLPIGVGRFYTGDTGIGVAQLLVTVVTCGIGALWSVVDGVLILVGDKTDAQGRPLRP